jgi:hypothetical protein
VDGIKLRVGATMPVDDIELWLFEDRERQRRKPNQSADCRGDNDGKKYCALNAAILAGSTYKF